MRKPLMQKEELIPHSCERNSRPNISKRHSLYNTCMPYLLRASLHKTKCGIRSIQLIIQIKKKYQEQKDRRTKEDLTLLSLNTLSFKIIPIDILNFSSTMKNQAIIEGSNRPTTKLYHLIFQNHSPPAGRFTFRDNCKHTIIVDA